MCISARSMDRKSRALLVVGLSLLAIGNSLRTLVHAHSASAQNTMDFASGFFLGLAITLLLWNLIRMRKRCQSDA